MFMYNAVREFILCGNTCVRAVDLRRFVSTVKEEGNVELSRQMSVSRTVCFLLAWALSTGPCWGGGG